MKVRTVVHSAVVLILTATVGYAQFVEPGWSFGAGGGGFSGQSATSANKARVGGHAFVRLGFARYLQGELNVMVGELAGKDLTPYKTTIIPVSLRLLYSPLELESVNPYLYAGGGTVRFKGQQIAGGPVLGTNPKSEGWATLFPAGFGFQARVSDHVSLEASGGYNFTLNDNIDYYFKSGGRDAFWSAFAGITYTLESGETDSDGDGLSNKLERQLKTDPNNADTDGDGLSDGDEYRKHRTSPRTSDTDRDGLSDLDEISKHQTDPRRADTDGDGLSDGDEIMKYRTDPLNRDSDADGLSDGDEVLVYKTDPLKKDTDADGLSDGDEITKHKTDPLRADTDLGGVNDGPEVARGTDPLNPHDDLQRREEIRIGKRVVLEGVNFRSGRSELTPESVARLEDVYLTLRDNSDIEVEISGHSDNTGSRAKNIDLSLARAEAVKSYLVTRGVASYRIRTKGYGPDRPVASNATEEGRAKNRRIEFTRIK